jgi:DNA invertase Pin-like site-specific DNA recombinase
MPESGSKTRRLGYARPSTYGQTLDAQLYQLCRDGCVKIYREKASGAQPTRHECLRMLKAVAPGDVVTVTRIDRLACSTRDLLNTPAITGKKARFRSFGDTWGNTTTSHGRLMQTVLAGPAEFERDLIRVRAGEGRTRAKARGQHMGRPPKLTPQQRTEARRWRAKGATLAELAKSYNVGRATNSRLG